MSAAITTVPTRIIEALPVAGFPGIMEAGPANDIESQIVPQCGITDQPKDEFGVNIRKGFVVGFTVPAGFAGLNNWQFSVRYSHPKQLAGIADRLPTVTDYSPIGIELKSFVKLATVVIPSGTLITGPNRTGFRLSWVPGVPNPNLWMNGGLSPYWPHDLDYIGLPLSAGAENTQTEYLTNGTDIQPLALPGDVVLFTMAEGHPASTHFIPFNIHRVTIEATP